ncbi:MAG: hypothetical protein HY305_03290 [Sphingobacteriales bacterium]|nr:hypothetical protein [Sphingobacteriales bacterium]
MNNVLNINLRSLVKCKQLVLRSILIGFVFLFSSIAAFSQFAVQVTPQVIGPFTLQLSDYYTGTVPKIIVTLTNRDLQQPTLNVRLRMSLRSQALQLVSRDDVFYPTITLQAGIPQQLSLADLAPYFNPENLNFYGAMTKANYQQHAKIPEGFYDFCFQAIEVNTKQQVSAEQCTSTWISLSDPPLLNLPAKGGVGEFREPTNILFSWTPRNLNSPNSAFSSVYDFQLVELLDNNTAPEQVFRSSQPLYEELGVKNTQLLYGPDKPQLIIGKKYGWRIRVRSTNGVDDQDIFRNNGFSEIYWFTYQEVCPPPAFITANLIDNKAVLTWQTSPKAIEYFVEYRNLDVPYSPWESISTKTTTMEVPNASFGSNYEYRIGNQCRINGGKFYTGT